MPHGHLASAVISATVRDVSKAQNIPVAVQYTLLSSSHMVHVIIQLLFEACHIYIYNVKSAL